MPVRADPRTVSTGALLHAGHGTSVHPLVSVAVVGGLVLAFWLAVTRL